jgi:hypothetical protein
VRTADVEQCFLGGLKLAATKKFVWFLRPDPEAERPSSYLQD